MTVLCEFTYLFTQLDKTVGAIKINGLPTRHEPLTFYNKK